MNKEAKPPDQNTNGEGEIYLYKEAGLRERHGYIPLWLILVAIGLFLWGIYYMIQNW
jgi:hypothetical protein